MNVCAYCDAPPTARCAACGAAYCGADCQSRDWPQHAHTCAAATSVGAPLASARAPDAAAAACNLPASRVTGDPVRSEMQWVRRYISTTSLLAKDPTRRGYSVEQLRRLPGWNDVQATRDYRSTIAGLLEEATWGKKLDKSNERTVQISEAALEKILMLFGPSSMVERNLEALVTPASGKMAFFYPTFSDEELAAILGSTPSYRLVRLSQSRCAFVWQHAEAPGRVLIYVREKDGQRLFMPDLTPNPQLFATLGLAVGYVDAVFTLAERDKGRNPRPIWPTVW